MEIQSFTQRVINVIRAIPEGTVFTYGGVAAMAGNHMGARQVVRVLHSSSRKENLPWHRVVNKEGCIALNEHQGFQRQKELLEYEGVEVDHAGRIDLARFLWKRNT